MFEFKRDYVFAWPVKVLVPTEDGQVEQHFTGLFKLLREDQHQALLASEKPDEDTARQTLIGWKEDLQQAGQPLAYSEAVRDELIALRFVRTAVCRAYWDAVNGALRQKN